MNEVVQPTVIIYSLGSGETIDKARAAVRAAGASEDVAADIVSLVNKMVTADAVIIDARLSAKQALNRKNRHALIDAVSVCSGANKRHVILLGENFPIPGHDTDKDSDRGFHDWLTSRRAVCLDATPEENAPALALDMLLTKPFLVKHPTMTAPA